MAYLIIVRQVFFFTDKLANKQNPMIELNSDCKP